MDPRFSPPADGGRPQNRLSGQLFAVNCCTYQMQASAADGTLRLWRNTRVASLTGNQTTTLGDSLIGYEWDESPDNGFRPPGLIHLSSTTINADQVLQDYGTTLRPEDGHPPPVALPGTQWGARLRRAAPSNGPGALTTRTTGGRVLRTLR